VWRQNVAEVDFLNEGEFKTGKSEIRLMPTTLGGSEVGMLVMFGPYPMMFFNQHHDNEHRIFINVYPPPHTINDAALFENKGRFTEESYPCGVIEEGSEEFYQLISDTVVDAIGKLGWDQTIIELEGFDKSLKIKVLGMREFTPPEKSKLN
jgi:hypothetical protein